MDGLRDTGLSVHEYQLNNLRFADDIDLVDDRRDMLIKHCGVVGSTVLAHSLSVP